MFYMDKRLQYPVRVDSPNPLFARSLQQAIGGVEGEIRVCMQYFFQAWGSRGPNPRYRDMLMHTATEEMGHIEMLATAVALNLEGAPATAQEAAAKDGVVGTIMGGGNGQSAIEGMLHRHLLSTGMAAYPANSDGVPFDMSHIYASGNLAADMYCNVAAESTGRVLACRLFNMTEDPGMRDMLSFMIARDTMHQQQWLAVIDELGGPAGALPIPNSFDQKLENSEFAYNFFASSADGTPPPSGRWTHGPALDGKGTYSVFQNKPLGEAPDLGPAKPNSGAERQQIV